jgi:hypothetical protein
MRMAIRHQERQKDSANYDRTAARHWGKVTFELNDNPLHRLMVGLASIQ